MKIGSNYMWNPTHEGDSLEFWLANNTGITLSDDTVEHWADNRAGSTRRWSQSTAANQPNWDDDSKGLDFDGSNDYITGSSIADQVTLDDHYLLGIRFKVEDATATNDVIAGDLNESNNFIRLNNANTIGIKHSSGQKTFPLNDASYFTSGTHHTLVVGRDGADVIRLWIDGVLQTSTASAAGSFKLDGLGARSGITNYFSGQIYELVVFKNLYSARIAQRISEHLMGLYIV